ncbi:transglutaminase [Sphingomonas spermidinifaciens]|uniref:Transglutaminase n=1 Tax=Sphingomonas spermidinifaciens TaxID=1141889 RepID=A0A2A4B4K1_9SPHN|nr:transglutaminase N-terminal domain-containing protein [Sphingomonas spermidinifaciens]PCD03000.1 transglutaminase [Sphingomonas spermidinifaciens]
MRLIVEHRTRYRFSEPQTRLIQCLRMTPDDTDDQTVIGWSIDVDCDARLRESRDGLGNRQAMLYADGPIDGIEISVRGEVLTGDHGGVVRGTHEPLPPVFYLRETERTVAGAALSGFMVEALAGGADAAAIDAVTRAIHGRFKLASHVEELRDAAATFAAEAATGRELAQMLVAGLRAAEIPARYVSGYRQREGRACAPHGWVEAFAGAEGWIAVDPSAGGRIDERYVRVAIGLDTASVTPVAGSRLGPGEEMLDVALIVEQARGQ